MPTGSPARARVVLHVGLPKTGTTYLQRLLAEQRERLRAAGVLYPFLRPAGMFHGAVDVRGSAAKFGLDPALVAGSWAALCERARAFPGTTLLGHEVLAGATPQQVAVALAPLEGLEVHVVVTARDLGRQATAHWQEEVKLGATASFAAVERDELRADTGRDAGPDAGGVRPHFWHAQDFAAALDRWAAGLPAGHGHLVVCPAPGAPPEELWRRFAAACGVPVDAVDPADVPRANASLGGPEIALLRGVNAAVDAAFGDRLDPATRLRVIKREYAEEVLAARGGAAPRAPYELGDLFGPVTRRWLDEVVAAGHLVHGDPGDLEPVLAPPGAPGPDVDPPADLDPGAEAERLVAALTTATTTATTTTADAGGPGIAGRLRRTLRRARGA